MSNAEKQEKHLLDEAIRLLGNQYETNKAFKETLNKPSRFSSTATN